ncbi:MAG: Cna B-type domain-containing protein [Eubacteriales bacterium]|nr:Cna B-type domain-containing protein [Clostridiales bacterium]MDY5836632.1 Cna B-type domain-containing protein [Eubacteriales bacterium]
MKGGSIEGNQANYGGGIDLNASTMYFSGGAIRGNIADTLRIDGNHYSAGGGILVREGSILYMSDGAQILNNRANQIGGGICLGTIHPGPQNTLYMEGGQIDGNAAGAAGGGIFIQTQYENLGDFCKAIISAGRITNNRMDGQGYGNFEFGGGGIYVNGANSGANGQLYLTNALITNNTSQGAGAGFAACPTTLSKFYVNQGVAIYDNHTEMGGRDLYALSSQGYGLHSGKAEYELSLRMLGGVPNHWKTEAGDLLPYDQYKGTLPDGHELSLHTDELGNELTRQWTKVLISGNHSATRGGGIGSNGSQFFGVEGDRDLKVIKRWADPNKTLTYVTVQLKANGVLIEQVDLSEANNWTHTFKGLPTQDSDGQPLHYTVEEIEEEGFEARVEVQPDGSYLITNIPKTKLEIQKGFPVVKLWQDNENALGIRPQGVILRILANGQDTGHVVALTAANKWKATICYDLPSLDDKGNLIEYSLAESPVEGYESEIKGNIHQGFTVTNSLKPKPSETVQPQVKVLPRTGQAGGMAYYALASLGLASVLSIVAYSLYRKR